MWYVFGANSETHQELFQSGWFVEALLSQTLIVHLIRTQKIPFLQSVASLPLILTTSAIAAVGVYTSLFAIGTNDRPGTASNAIFRLAADDPHCLQHSHADDQSLVHSEISLVALMMNTSTRSLTLRPFLHCLNLSLCLLNLGWMNHAGGQDSPSQPVTIQQAIQEALEKNLGLLAERYNPTIAEARIATARLRPNPVLSVGGDHLNLVGPRFTEENGGGSSEYSTRLDFIIEGIGKRSRRIEVAENAHGVAQMQLANATRVLMLEVQNAFLEAFSAKANLALGEESLKAFNQIVELNSTRVRAGDLAAVELIRHDWQHCNSKLLHSRRGHDCASRSRSSSC